MRPRVRASKARILEADCVTRESRSKRSEEVIFFVCRTFVREP